MSYVTKPATPTVGDLLQQLGLPRGLSGLRAALKLLLEVQHEARK